jgi:hypothetical protein
MGKTIEYYEIVSGYNPLEIKQEIADYLKKGFEPYGGLVILDTIMLQPMVKYKINKSL